MPASRMMVVFAVAAFTVLALSGCGSTRIFWADFEADALGSPPNTSPPGPPSGDQIGGAVTSSYPAVVVYSPELRSKALRYANTDPSPTSRHLWFSSAEVDPASTREFTAMWTGVLTSDPNGSGLKVWLGGGHYTSFGTLHFKGGNVFVVTDTAGNPDPPSQLVGSYRDGVPHTIIMTVDKSDGTFRATILGDGRVIDVPRRPVGWPSQLGTKRAVVYMLYNDGALTGSGTYVVDEVHIRRR